MLLLLSINYFVHKIMLKMSKFLTVVFSCGVLFSGFAESVKAQVNVRVPLQSVARTKTATVSQKPQVRIQRVVVVEQKIKRETKFVKTRNLVVSSELGATVLLEGPGVKPVTKYIPKDNPKDKSVEFQSLLPIKYKVTASLDGYKIQETDVKIPAEETIGITLDLEPVKYPLTIETNVDEGEVRFALLRKETKPDGSLQTVETGSFCIVPIKNKVAVFNELQTGYYNIDIRATAVEYQQILTEINIPSDILDPKTKALQSYQIDLVKKISEGTFASVSKDDWVLPDGWRLQERAMKTMGVAGIALPRNEQQYGYYTNFEMTSDVILTDGKTIGFALRALDSQNYYLVQFSGANAAEPFLASGFVIKDGKPSPALFSTTIDHFSKTIKSKKSFRVFIKGEENIFKIFIEDSQTGDRKEVGNIIDRDKNFRKGAIGIVGRENSNSEIGYFTVCAKFCR